jgi:thymidine kinase
MTENTNTNTNTNTHSKKDTGYLEVIIGPMFSGKTSKLIEIYKQCIFCNIPVCIINHSIDTRYHDTMISTHDRIMVPCIQANNLNDVWINNNVNDNNNNNNNNNNIIRNNDVFLINEGQFFPDLYGVVLDMVNNNKTVYICGLDGDFERNKFGQILDLIPYCDAVTKLTSLCSLCKNGSRGIFSMRTTGEKQQTLIGSDNYIPVCRKCYETNSNNYKK